MNIKISVTVDSATPLLAAERQIAENTAGLNKAMGMDVVETTSRHVGEWGLSHPNKLGGRRTNYWRGIAAKINPADTLEVSDQNATMTLSGDDMPGITRAFGDVTIVPGTKTAGAKYIPIPARGEAYGLRPREMTGLVLFWRGKGKPGGLAEGVEQTRTHDTKRGKKGSTYLVPGLVMYWFADSVTQPQDRTLLPSEEEWTESATRGARRFLVIERERIRGGAS